MNMARLALLALLLLPILEIIVLVKLAAVLGVALTLLLLVLAGVAGSWLMRVQGFSTLARLQEALAKGELPAREIIESGLLAFGGLLLLIPGFLSDILALFCLIPATRRRLARFVFETQPGGMTAHRDEFDGGTTIEGEYKREDD